jgi:polyphosphate kinase 2 (PPK2 family)
MQPRVGSNPRCWTFWPSPPTRLLCWSKGGYPYKNLMSRRRYESQKYQLHVELLKLQNWAKETGQRVVILFEGRDAAGKGGAINRFRHRCISIMP